MDGSAYVAGASIIVAVVSAAAGELSRRAAAKASRQNTVVASSVEIEKLERAAYERAEQMLDRQFRRQEEEIEGLHADVARLEHKVRELEATRDDDRHTIAQRDAQIQTYAALLAARGIDPT